MTTTEMVHPIEILLVEDNPGDARLAKEALKESKLKNNLYIADDGVEAMDFLYKKGKYANMPRPDLVILDLNLPRKDGREVLSEIKTDDNLKRIPVVILTISKAVDASGWRSQAPRWWVSRRFARISWGARTRRTLAQLRWNEADVPIF